MPASCPAGQTCRLMVALHGCQQHDAIGIQFIDDTNLDQYADTNMIVLYPQATAANPNGCWAWWATSAQGTRTTRSVAEHRSSRSRTWCRHSAGDP